MVNYALQTALDENNYLEGDIMKKLSIRIIIGLLIIGLVCTVGYFLFAKKGVNITISNHTNQSISNCFIKINYSGSANDIVVPAIASGESQEISVELPDDFTEGSLILCYTDNNNNKQEKTIIGYLEKNYNIDIALSIDDSGRIIIN
ncbi:MAG: hypothetical protein IJW18_04370 [Lachnospiraceae bacterium]|nr:hypothetical protein [Lachnospiraceae bacterium]